MWPKEDMHLSRDGEAGMLQWAANESYGGALRLRNGTWAGFMRADRDYGEIAEVDLSKLTWVDPVMIAGIAAICQRESRSSNQVVVVPPEDGNTRAYLARMRLGKALDSLGVAHGLGTVNERDQQGNLFELREFSSEKDGEELAQIVHDRLRENSDVNPQVPQAMHEALIEIATNVALHADVPHGYAIAQTYPQKRQIKFAVADCGIGFKASLEKNRNIHVDDDKHAMELAIIRSVSGTNSAHRGYGLADVVRSATELKGKVEIASGSVQSRHSAETNEGDTTDASYTANLSSPYTGVIVQASIPWDPAR